MTQNCLLWSSLISVKAEFLRLTIKHLFIKSEIECFTNCEVQLNPNKSTNSEICVGTLKSLTHYRKSKKCASLFDCIWPLSFKLRLFIINHPKFLVQGKKYIWRRDTFTLCNNMIFGIILEDEVTPYPPLNICFILLLRSLIYLLPLIATDWNFKMQKYNLFLININPYSTLKYVYASINYH